MLGARACLQFTVYAALVAIVTLTSSVYPTKPYTCPEDLEGSDDGLSSRSFPSFAQRGRDMSQHSDSYPTTEAATPSASRDSSWHGGAPARGGGGSELAEPLLGELMAIQEVPMESTNELCLDLSALPLGEQLCTPEWIGLLCFFLVHLLTSTFYLSAVGDQLSCWACGCATRCGVGDGCMGTCTPDAKASGREWLTVFGAVYPLGFITTPICGYLQDRFHLSVLLFFVNGSMLLWQLLAAVPVMEVQMATIVVFASARQFIFSFFFAAVGSSFGYENFGFLTGLANGAPRTGWTRRVPSPSTNRTPVAVLRGRSLRRRPRIQRPALFPRRLPLQGAQPYYTISTPPTYSNDPAATPTTPFPFSHSCTHHPPPRRHAAALPARDSARGRGRGLAGYVYLLFRGVARVLRVRMVSPCSADPRRSIPTPNRPPAPPHRMAPVAGISGDDTTASLKRTTRASARRTSGPWTLPSAATAPSRAAMAATRRPSRSPRTSRLTRSRRAEGGPGGGW